MKILKSISYFSYPLLSLILFLFLFPVSALLSQSPLGIPYQAVVRNADGTVMSNTALTMIFKIYDQSATGTLVYQESHSITSNAQGLVSCNVGNGMPTQGTFASISWGNGAKFLHVLMNAGNGELDLGTQQMMSVPYALYAEKSGSSVPAGSAPGELMYWNGEGWSSIPPGGYGQTLFLCDGVPTWGGCVPKLGEIQVGVYPATLTPDSSGKVLFNLNFHTDILSSGVLSNNYNEFLSIGCFLSTDSTFSDSILNIESYIQYGGNYPSNPFIASSAQFSSPLATTYYVKVYCQNSVGTGFSQVKTWTTPNTIIQGCTDVNACNYNALANFGDGSCAYPSMGCNDNDSSTSGSIYNSDCQCLPTVPEYTQGSGVEDIDGNFYPSVIIYGQEWMQKNLSVNTYRNGDPITLLSPGETSTDVAAYTYYNNDLNNVATYGNLYNWYVVGDVRGVCPSGWHVPTDNDWITLFNNLNIVSTALDSGMKLKSSEGWPAGGGGNETGFSALPGGKYYPWTTYQQLNSSGFWWSSDLIQGYASKGVELRSGSYGVTDFWQRPIQEFLSIRCLKD